MHLTQDRERIATIDFDEESSPKSALIHFEKAPAAKTALMVSACPSSNRDHQLMGALRSSTEGRSMTLICPSLLMRLKAMRMSLRCPRQGQVSTRPISHALQVRVPELQSQGCTTTLTTVPVAAEYLAKGYALSDQILQRAIELDRTCLSLRLHRPSQRPSVGFHPNREARDFKALHQLLPLNRFDSWAEGSWA